MVGFFGDEIDVLTPRHTLDTPSRRQRLWGDPAAEGIGDRVTIANTAGPGNYATAGRTLGWFAADPLAGNRITATGRFLILARNDSGGTQTVSTYSGAQPDTAIVYTQSVSIAPGNTAILGPLTPIVWNQTDNYTYVTASSASVFLAVVTPA